MKAPHHRAALVGGALSVFLLVSLGLAFGLPLDATDRSTPFDDATALDSDAFTERASLHVDDELFGAYTLTVADDGAEHLRLEANDSAYREERYTSDGEIIHRKTTVDSRSAATGLAANADGEVVDRYSDGESYVLIERANATKASTPAEAASQWRQVVRSALRQADYERVDAKGALTIYAARDAWNVGEDVRDVRVSDAEGEVAVDGAGQVDEADVSYRVTPAMSYGHYYANRDRSQAVTATYEIEAGVDSVTRPDWVAAD